MTRILALFTCYDRKEKTEQCIRSIVKANAECSITFIIADDGSTDGTVQMIKELKKDYSIYLLTGNGSLFYSGGMRMLMEYVKKQIQDTYDYVLMINDDVVFLSGCITNLIGQSEEQDNAIIVGSMRNSDGDLSYGAIKYFKGVKYRTLGTEDWMLDADTFNANCVLIPWKVFGIVETMDTHYVHSLGDFDYGLSIKKHGFKIHSSKNYVGICNNNSTKGTWTDNTLSRKQRIEKKECVKGAPTKQWFYFLRKNFGLLTAIKGCITPYVRITIGK